MDDLLPKELLVGLITSSSALQGRCKLSGYMQSQRQQFGQLLADEKAGTSAACMRVQGPVMRGQKRTLSLHGCCATHWWGPAAGCPRAGSSGVLLPSVQKAACSADAQLAAGIPFLTWGLGQTLPLLALRPPPLLIEC